MVSVLAADPIQSWTSSCPVMLAGGGTVKGSEGIGTAYPNAWDTICGTARSTDAATKDAWGGESSGAPRNFCWTAVTSSTLVCRWKTRRRPPLALAASCHTGGKRA